MKEVYKAGMLAVISLLIISCDQSKKEIELPKNNSAEIKKYIQQIKSELIFVQGGNFPMGDFGEKYGKERLPYDAKQDSKPLHKVELTSYSISQFKTSNKEYQFYLTNNGMKLRVINEGARNNKRWDEINSTPDTPAHVDWNEAEKYCEWLSTVTNLPFSLSTEAQWEYAARNRGQFFILPTNDGTIRVNEGSASNVATAKDSKAYSKKMGTSLDELSALPGGLYPPNPLGIYDMSGNGWEWVKDWYDPDYYQYSPVKDPQGPDKPIFKDLDGHFTRVMRGQDFSGPYRGLTVVRFNADPESRDYPPMDKTVRCVVNSPNPIK